jgi:hypothetical protein
MVIVSKALLRIMVKRVRSSRLSREVKQRVVICFYYFKLYDPDCRQTCFGIGCHFATVGDDVYYVINNLKYEYAYHICRGIAKVIQKYNMTVLTEKILPGKVIV